MPSLATLLDDLVADQWRETHPFALDLAECHSALCSAQDDAARSAILGAWLTRRQPCIFGQLAAKKGWIDYCFLSEADVRAGDLHVAGKISLAHLTWRRRARRGESHAFVILAASERLAKAEPNPALLAFAQQLAELYLSRPVVPDRIFHDELFYEAKERRSWKVGVNYFGAQGDGRWWKDHRIPGGVALSMNSVGHMACVRRLAKGTDAEDPVAGLHWALPIAMQLLNSTVDGPSGRDTWLHSVTEVKPTTECPMKLPRFLDDKNWCQYGGLYHTDQSIPSDYFTPAEHRPDTPKLSDLDLTYLHHDSPDNPDYQSMGVGLPTP